MLKTGVQQIAGLYAGETKITKAYLGEDLIFGVEKPSRLPEGYTELEYVEFNGNQYIQTNITANKNTNISCRAAPADRGASIKAYVIFSSYAVVYSTYYTFSVQFNIQTSVSSKADSFYGVIGTSPSGAVTKIRNIYAPNPYDIEFDTASKTITVNGASYTFPNNDVTETLKPFVIGCKSVNTNGTLSTPFSGKLYAFNLIQNGNTMLELVPAQNTDGIAGFYDLANSVFVRSASSTDFLPGPAV